MATFVLVTLQMFTGKHLATSCLRLHLFVNTFNTALLQLLYNNWIQKQQNYNLSTCSSTLMLYLVQCKSIANWLNLQHFYNILVKYTTVVFDIFFPVLMIVSERSPGLSER